MFSSVIAFILIIVGFGLGFAGYEEWAGIAVACALGWAWRGVYEAWLDLKETRKKLHDSGIR